jgi:hypothetical protein
MRQSVASATAVTHSIDAPCKSDIVIPTETAQPCHLAEMDHYGELGTGFLWCHTHGRVVGTVDRPLSYYHRPDTLEADAERPRRATRFKRAEDEGPEFDF